MNKKYFNFNDSEDPWRCASIKAPTAHINNDHYYARDL